MKSFKLNLLKGGLKDKSPDANLEPLNDEPKTSALGTKKLNSSIERLNEGKNKSAKKKKEKPLSFKPKARGNYTGSSDSLSSKEEYKLSAPEKMKKNNSLTINVSPPQNASKEFSPKSPIPSKQFPAIQAPLKSPMTPDIDKALTVLGKPDKTFSINDVLKIDLALFRRDIEALMKKYNPEDINAPVGLQNLGNTCYINAVLQCLSCIKPLVVYFKNKKPNASVVITTFENWLRQYWISTSICDGSSIKSIVENHNSTFQGNEQHDAHEFLNSLLVLLHDEMNRVKFNAKFNFKQKDQHLVSNSFLSDIFCGMLESKGPPTKVNLEDCLETFFSSEIIDKSANYVCSQCTKAQMIEKKMSVITHPQILVIRKLNTQIVLPELLNINALGADVPEQQSDQNHCSKLDLSYELFAICNHNGTLSNGHYYANVKLNEKWYIVNDKDSKLGKPALVSKEAYLLFYEKQTNK
ncbi:cysteine proteinase [Rozella allomycis CSF55]|uniref:Ubiquitin carboxyl-terminal hydrolase n=1 Tax=Rozella allomycis (strain CSF55) TaxID=988480 RepID=A0A075ART8_ROZAC|nr:Peptidase C19, ubiquitin carboxyl-terminal hydrolase 2 domain-containing protein [Rozella allomycis CSF55]RKP21805.1 cysteine proteinase [Rozella allomycis CSF55]|eukprot:EPZ31431.1 Peptidase C19, ubiquitin carboxyl-terminal hydrolase 2 domain-containing protein [Rozella allomycis CSF55]